MFHENIDAEVDARMEARAPLELTQYDPTEEFDEWFDREYSLHNVGGPFRYASASVVLCRYDPDEYDRWKSEFESERFACCDGEYYDIDEYNRLEDRIRSEVEDENEEHMKQQPGRRRNQEEEWG